MARRPDRHAVFLNIPQDARYQPFFATLVSTLVDLGQKPKCAAMVPEKGRGRMRRIADLLYSCRVSIHDLCRQGNPSRFNMPFELGLAYSFMLLRGKHDVIVFDSDRYRLARVLSDYPAADIESYQGRCDHLISALLDHFELKDGPLPGELRSDARYLRQVARQLVVDYRASTIFKPAPIRALLAAATQRALDRGYILP